MVASPAKFTFDLDLRGKTDEDAGKQVLSDAALAMLIQNARQDGYAEGFSEGERGVVAAQALGLTAAAETLAGRSQTIMSTFDQAQKEAISEAVALSAVIARKLASNLIAREPIAELEVLIKECFASLEGVPHLVIRCHPDLADKIREIATARMAHTGFDGRLVVMGDPDLALGDGRIEWVDGGLVRDFNALSAEIDNRIAAYLAALGPTGADDNTH
jgi:flagellar assembly protein FliH